MKVKCCEDCENLLRQVRTSLNHGNAMEAASIQSYFEAHYFAIHRRTEKHDTMAFRGFHEQLQITGLPGGKN